MDQRMLLAIALSMLVLIGYYALFPPPTPPPAEQAPGQTAGERPEAAVGSDRTGDGASPVPEQGAAAVTEQASARRPAPALEAPTSGKLVQVNTPLYRAEVDTSGGKLVSLRLKEYLARKENIDWADVIPPLREFLSKPEIDPDAHVEMVKRLRPEDQALGLRFIGEDSLTRAFRDVNFIAEEDAVRIPDRRGDPVELTLTGTGPEGLTVMKTLTFHPDSYIIDYHISVINYGGEARLLRLAPMFGEGPRSPEADSFRYWAGPIWREDGDVDTEEPDDIEGQLIVREPEWLGIADTYFITAVQPRSRISHAFYESAEVPRGGDTEWVATYGSELPQVTLQPNNMISSQFQLYMGPKDAEEMARFGSKLEEALDLNLDILARPMLALMRWFHSFTGNWGVAIILLTVVVRVVLFPLTYKGMVNIKRMQKLQPRMKALRDKYKDDRERMNKEMMQMYRRYKMNPLGGCLPIALQIPIFFALYSALLGAIELRHTEFALWITDLSAKDGLYVLPVLMGASMFLQMQMSPTSPDPTQAKIMKFMPLIFTAFMFQFPSGLVLYWLTSNTLSILQQVLINRAHIPEPAEQPA